jgi:hypothetical protein
MLATDVFAHGMPLTPLGKKLSETHKGRSTHFAGLGAEAYVCLDVQITDRRWKALPGGF